MPILIQNVWMEIIRWSESQLWYANDVHANNGNDKCLGFDLTKCLGRDTNLVWRNCRKYTDRRFELHTSFCESSFFSEQYHAWWSQISTKKKRARHLELAAKKNMISLKRHGFYVTCAIDGAQLSEIFVYLAYFVVTIHFRLVNWHPKDISH